MCKLNKSVLLLVLIICFVSCKQTTHTQHNPSHIELENRYINHSGNYVSESYSKRDMGYDWVAVKINQTSPGQISISIRSRADKKKPSCTFDSIAEKIKDNTFQTIIEKKTILFEFNHNALTISTKDFDDRFILMYFCNGGGSLMGEYKKITEELDHTQIDKKPFFNTTDKNTP
ncbi:hypothetical protein UJ101_01715 [Flavobacteriaceae bacterium UJ101]|nr:hypothetical protein UJ101_01715 [Flavobacteriaceae bacterium UJ101]